MKRERNEGLKAPGLVLQRPRANHVIDALRGCLDVAVEHRHVRAHAQPMRDAVNVEVSRRPTFVVGKLAAYALRKDLGASTWEGIEPGRHELNQHLLVSHPIKVCEERDLDGREAF